MTDWHSDLLYNAMMLIDVKLSSVQVSSATATFAMTFSSSMSVVEYYLLKRFPVPYGNHYSLTENFLIRISWLHL